MSERSLKVLLERGGEITVKGFPQALGGPSGQKLQGELKAAKKTSAWPLIGDRGPNALLDLLDLDVMEVLAAGWNKYRVLSEFADPDRHPADESNDVALDDHSLSMTYRPALEITVDGVKRGSIEFTLTVALQLKAVILIIKGGRIMGLRTGSCSGKVTLDLDGAEIVNHDLAAVDLPGLLELGKGVPIPVLRAGTAEVPAAHV
jgi:hypothetical protein